MIALHYYYCYYYRVVKTCRAGLGLELECYNGKHQLCKINLRWLKGCDKLSVSRGHALKENLEAIHYINHSVECLHTNIIMQNVPRFHLRFILYQIF